MTSQTPSLSFEVFPPNPAVGNEKILRALEDMQGLAPHFISVTASNNKYNIKETTVPLADHIQNDLAIPTIAHLPAIYLSKEKVADTLRDLDAVCVHRILALRGDIIPGVEPLKDFRYATDLIEFIKEEAPQFDIIGACYPEGHPDSPNQISDIQNLKKKVDAGCSSLLTQLFFDNAGLVEKDATYLSNARHISLIEKALESLEAVNQGLELGMPVDLLQIDMTRTWEILGEITGDAAPDELITQLFSQFCLGK